MTDIVPNPVNSQPLQCLIIDDEEIAIDGIIDYMKGMEGLQVAGTCPSALEALEILKQKDIDLMFLDINMPRLTGLEFLESLAKPPLTILTTAYSEHALEAFRLHVVDYLLKPYTFQRFVQAVQKALKASRPHPHTETTDLYIRQGSGFQRVDWEEIHFVEAMQNYLKLHLKNNVFIIHQTMTSLEEMLPKTSFFRIHNSFLVNIKQIDTISGRRLFIDGKELPISKHRKEDLLNTVVYKKLISK